MSNFLTSKEKKISNEFETKGFLIRNIEDHKSLKKLRDIFKTLLEKFKNKKNISGKKIFLILLIKI